MALIINSEERTFLESIQTDTNTLMTSGVAVDTDGNGTGDTSYCTAGIVPVTDYTVIVPPGSDSDLKARDGFRVASIPLLHRVMPIGWQAIDTAPNITFTANTALLTLTIPASERPTVARKVLITATWSAWANGGTNTALNYWVTDGVTETPRIPFIINETGPHHSMSASWIYTLQPQTATLTLRALRVGAGAASFVVDGNDHLSLTVIG